MKLEYTATNEKGDKINFYAFGEWTCNDTDRLNARHWIINHLDMSENWTYKKTGNFQHEPDKEEVCPECGGDGFFDIDESSVHEGEVLESYDTEECKKCNGKGKIE